MTHKSAYKTASSLRRALEDRLLQTSRTEKIDVQRLRRQVGFDRLLDRIFSRPANPFVLKGGYAMQLRVDHSRATRDVDLALRDIKLLSSESKTQNLAIRDVLRQAAATDLGDFFVYVISEPIMELEAAPYGGSRFHVEAKLDGRSFEKFLLDIGVGDAWLEPLDDLQPHQWLEFAGIMVKSYPAISKEQQFAEKLHAYTIPRREGIINSRTKDLIDLIILINTGDLNIERLTQALKATYKKRDTHALSGELTSPPTSWSDRFNDLAAECDLSIDLTTAFNKVQAFVKKLPI